MWRNCVQYDTIPPHSATPGPSVVPQLVHKLFYIYSGQCSSMPPHLRYPTLPGTPSIAIAREGNGHIAANADGPQTLPRTNRQPNEHPSRCGHQSRTFARNRTKHRPSSGITTCLNPASPATSVSENFDNYPKSWSKPTSAAGIELTNALARRNSPPR